MRDWAVVQAWGSCYSWAALSSNDSKTLYTYILYTISSKIKTASSPASIFHPSAHIHDAARIYDCDCDRALRENKEYFLKTRIRSQLVSEEGRGLLSGKLRLPPSSPFLRSRVTRTNKCALSVGTDNNCAVASACVQSVRRVGGIGEHLRLKSRAAMRTAPLNSTQVIDAVTHLWDPF